jgi:hypothetical protein
MWSKKPPYFVPPKQEGRLHLKKPKYFLNGNGMSIVYFWHVMTLPQMLIKISNYFFDLFVVP